MILDRMADIQSGGGGTYGSHPLTGRGGCEADQADLRVRSPRVGLLCEPNGSISWGLLFKPLGRL
jgi:hypothetical protein